MSDVRVSARTLALLADAADLRRLRVAHRDDVELYAELNNLAAVALAYRMSPEVRTDLGVYARSPEGSDLTTAEAAAQLGITPAGVLKAIHRGRLDARRRGGCWLVDPGSLTRYATRAA